MNFATSYRLILKQLKKGCNSQPHFINDVRVLLSLGMIGRKELTSFPPTYSSLHSSSAKECMQVDTEALWTRCKTDLRQAIERKIDHFSGKRLPLIASQIMYKKELNWLSERLQTIIHSSTSSTLSTLRKISEGASQTDFIPDSFFDTCTSTPAEVDVPCNHENVVGDSTLYSAGGIGHHREPVVYCHREKDFPLMHSFLGPSVVGSEEFEERYTQAKCILRLIHSTQYSLESTSCTEGENAKVQVEALPFDEEYKNKSEAGVGQFSTAHRQFYVHISLFGLNEKMVQIVNVHFFRLEMNSKDLLEDIGYMDFSQICSNVREKLLEVGVDSSLNTLKEKANQTDGVRVGTKLTFKVAFKSLADGPTILKGILYYKCGESVEVLRERSLEAITFGPIVYHC